MTGFDSKRSAAADKDALFEKFELTQPAQEKNTITFSTSSDWVMRITADRRIEVNEGVEVTDAAKKVLEAMQWMLKPAQEPVGMLHIERLDKWLDASLKERKQREWVGLTPEETSGFTQHEMTVVKYVSKVLQEKNG